jgi:Receptor family ligand binding region
VNCRNIWFNEFWEQRHKCKLDWRNSTKCTGDEDLKEGYEQEGLVPFVIDAVYALAHAIDDIIKSRCGDYGYGGDCWKSLLPIGGYEMLTFIHNVSFKGAVTITMKSIRAHNNYKNIYLKDHKALKLGSMKTVTPTATTIYINTKRMTPSMTTYKSAHGGRGS